MARQSLVTLNKCRLWKIVITKNEIILRLVIFLCNRSRQRLQCFIT